MGWGAMQTLALIGSGILLCILAVFAWLAFTAPLGWQDEDGFHFGESRPSGDFDSSFHGPDND